MMGSAAAWFLTDEPAFDGRVLVVERDPTFVFAATSHTNSCIRQQFSTAVNVAISRFGADFIQSLPARMGHDQRVPDLRIQSFGYLYLADTEAAATRLAAAQAVQAACGAATRLLTPEQIAAIWPFYAVDDLILGSHNAVDEGYFDGITLFDCWRRQARERGVEVVTDIVVAMSKSPDGRIRSVTLASGRVVGCGHVVNASGTRGAATARMAGIDIPVEPRKRHTWVFSAETPLDRDLPLTIDPAGVHVRQDQRTTYMAGGHGTPDPCVDPDDFEPDHALWQDHVWPIIAARIPQFEAIRVMREWVGHYDYNTLDQNAIAGPHPDVPNFLFMNGFSGHGLQQSPAMGRGVAEWITHGGYRTLDLSPLHFDRIAAGSALVEQAII